MTQLEAKQLFTESLAVLSLAVQEWYAGGSRKMLDGYHVRHAETCKKIRAAGYIPSDLLKESH